jgi:hypothetical protein
VLHCILLARSHQHLGPRHPPPEGARVRPCRRADGYRQPLSRPRATCQ